MFIKILKFSIYFLIVSVLAFFLGFIGWFFLYIVNTVLHFLWIGPEIEGTILNGFLYSHQILIVPYIMLGCLALGYIFNRIGTYPKPGIYYAGQFKENTKIEYKDIVKIFFLAMCPLFLGAAIGPEAAVIGIYFILASLVSDVVYIVGRKLDIKVVKHEEEEFTKRLLKNKLYLFQMGLIYFITIYVIVHLSSLDKYPSFFVKLGHVSIGIDEIIFFIPLVIMGYVLARFYKKTEKLLENSVGNLGQYTRILLAGFVLSIFALVLPILLLSGEATLHILVTQPILYSGIVLIILAFFKLFLTNLCISGDLRGGHIFPIIFSGFLLATGIGEIFDLNLTFCITVVTTTSCFKIFSNVFAVFLLLALFFPVKLLIVVLGIVLIFREKIAAEKKEVEL